MCSVLVGVHLAAPRGASGSPAACIWQLRGVHLAARRTPRLAGAASSAQHWWRLPRCPPVRSPGAPSRGAPSRGAPSRGTFRPTPLPDIRRRPPGSARERRRAPGSAGGRPRARARLLRGAPEPAPRAFSAPGERQTDLNDHEMITEIAGTMHSHQSPCTIASFPDRLDRHAPRPR